ESRGTAGLFHRTRRLDGRMTVMIEEGELENPTSLVATIAHELGHVHLIGHGRLSGDEPDQEPLTDLLTVFHGLGIFTANASVQEENWLHLNSEGWRLRKHGYLSQREIGYGLALCAWLRDEERPPWASHLCLDVRSCVKEGLRYLRKGELTEDAHALRRALLG